MWRSKDGSHTKKKKKSRLQFKKVSVWDRAEFKHMLSSHWNIVSNHIFHVKCVINAGPNRDLDTRLKPLSWDRGYKKASGVSADQTKYPNLHPASTKRARETQRRRKSPKKRAGSSGDTSEGKTCKLGLILTMRCGNYSSLGRSSTGVDDTSGFITPTWTPCVQVRGRWMLMSPTLESQDPFILLTHALDTTLGYVPTATRGL